MGEMWYVQAQLSEGFGVWPAKTANSVMSFKSPRTPFTALRRGASRSYPIDDCSPSPDLVFQERDEAVDAE